MIPAAAKGDIDIVYALGVHTCQAGVMINELLVNEAT